MMIVGNCARVEAATAAEFERVARSYDTHADFDGVLASYIGRLIASRIDGLRTLECSCACGVMTDILLRAASDLVVVEASEHCVSQLLAHFGDSIAVRHALLEEFQPDQPFKAVVMAGLLHHLSDPAMALSRASRWLIPGRRLYITVPNLLSFHRRLHVAMGGSESPFVTPARNKRFHQPGRFT